MDFASFTPGCNTTRCNARRNAGRQIFFTLMALVFVACAAVTIMWCASMSAMRDMPMPGGWSVSMTWLPMCGQRWTRVAASFIGMWIVMMIAMMLPSFAPVLWRYHEAISCNGAKRAAWSTLRVGVGYFFAWAIAGVIVFASGVTLMVLSLRFALLSRALPLAAGVAVLAAGLLQLTAWKARYLASCRTLSAKAQTPTALRTGMHFGVHCILSCVPLTVALLIYGVMDWHVMMLVTAAITAERLAPRGARIATATGVCMIASSLPMLARAAGIV